MKKKIITAITAIIFLMTSSFATAVCLKGHRSVAEEYADTENIIIGKVIKKKDIPEVDNYEEGTNYTVEIQEIIKGNLNKSVIIFSENSSGRFPMSIGKTYILFIYYNVGRYQIDNCGNSGLLSKKEEIIKTLLQLKK